MLKNLLIPFRRDRKRDFAADGGTALLISKVTQVLMTDGASPFSSGELPWRTNFGSKLNLIRHRNNDDVTRELARVWIRDALRRWLPTVKLSSVVAVRDGASLTLKIKVREGEVEVAIDHAVTR
jgi:phage baseplate assembly protein W